MQSTQFLLAITLLAVLAETTYLVVKVPKQTLTKKQRRPVFIDTSVLIDGRIVAVARSGFMNDAIIIPRSVVGELQFLADNADHEKRARARHGLDIVSELQQIPQLDVEILQDGSKAEEGVDERLLMLAKKHNGAICTIDYNLNKVAVVEGITVLNVNELAQSLRMAYLPGERMLLEIVQKGQDSHQGVGYLSDGTMVVVEQASKLIGQTAEIEFIRSLQTAAGKMMFARLTQQPGRDKPQQQRPAGKKPINKQQQAPKEKPATVFHSDRNDQRLAGNDKKKPETPKQLKKQQPTVVARPAKKRPQTSKQHEDTLIELVEKQS